MRRDVIDLLKNGWEIKKNSIERLETRTFQTSSLQTNHRLYHCGQFVPWNDCKCACCGMSTLSWFPNELIEGMMEITKIKNV